MELAYGGWNKHKEWGLATGNRALVAMTNIFGMKFIPPLVVWGGIR